MNNNLSICFFIVFIAFISGCVEADTVPSTENVSSNTFGDYAALYIKEIENIGNGTYFEITDDELKEHPEINKSIHGDGCTKSDYGGWYCELNSNERGRYSDFFNRKHTKYLFSIDLKFKNNLNNDTIDAELINSFKSHGFPLSENYSTLAIPRSFYNTPYDWWFIDEKVDTPEYTI